MKKIILLRTVLVGAFLLGCTSPPNVENIVWSDKPGCFERYLQRKYKNPLFPKIERKATAKEVAQAKTKDKADADALRKDYLALAEKITKLPDLITVKEARKYREEVDMLMQRCAEVGGGNVEDINKELIELRKAVIDSCRKAYLSINDKEGIKALDEAEEFWHSNKWKCYNPFIAQLNRENTPIKDNDVVPSLLTEDPKTIKTALLLLKESMPEAEPWIRNICIQVLRSTKEISDTYVNERLKVLEL